MGQLRKHFRLALPLLGLSFHPLAGIELSRPFDYELLNDRSPAGDEEE